ncbi:OmpA family protein [Pantoea sp. GD03673]|uniref:OmpA family protein n=1 Tax=Pantoea sp. GD03673 TaxID=2975364 RepID=UPI002449DEB9|nr:OmpA family protein [Pantoea sp. GD03673]MDH2067223.1 OmpA family protein [Pantoea sp. GD03673]
MSRAQQRLLALWAALLSALVCLGFLPLSWQMSGLILLAVWGVISAVWVGYRVSRQAAPEVNLDLSNLPEVTWRQPVVLVCGDLSQPWPEQSQVLTVAQGCWIRVEDHQDLDQVARQLLLLRPDWGQQLSVMISVCPQMHAETEALTSRLMNLRWQISQLRKTSGHSVPVVLMGVTGSTIMNELLWQAATPGESICVWRESAVPDAVPVWVTTGSAMAMQQQVLMNSLMIWFHHHVRAVFVDDNPDIAAVMPTAMLWGSGPRLSGSLASSLWSDWLIRHTGLKEVAGWQPMDSDTAAISPLPDFILPLLPQGRGPTPRDRAWCGALGLFTLAAVAALLCSGWNNRQLLQRLSFDIDHYDRISTDNYAPKVDALQVLRQDAAQLDEWARNGEPVRLSLGLYLGQRLRMPVLEAIRSYIPPPPPPPEPEKVVIPKIVRLDSLSLFDSGKAELKAGSTKVLVNALVDIKARPGWLIVVAGHTDITGNTQRNQLLSRERAEAVRDWMRDTGDLPESCFAVQGYGDSRPVASNDTPEGRGQNRRVEISLVPQADACRMPDAVPASQDDSDVSTQ